MALSFEDFQELRKQGLSDEQIDKFESGYVPEEASVKGKPRSIVSKTWEQLNRKLAFLAGPTTKKGFAPLASSMTKDEGKKAKYKEIIESDDPKYLGDVAEVAAPGLFENVQDAPWQYNLGKTASRIGLDIAGDPLSYLGFGLPTKVGKISKLVHEAIKSGQTIKLDSKLAREIAKQTGRVTKASTTSVKVPSIQSAGGIKEKSVEEIVGELNKQLKSPVKPSPQMINKFLERHFTPGKTFAKQVEQGESSLLSAGLPFNEGQIPLLTGKHAAKLVQPFSAIKHGATGQKIDNAVRELFSTKSGDPDFDVLVTKARDQIQYRKGLVIEDAKVMQKQMSELSRDLGIPREKLNYEFNRIGEELVPSSKAMSKQKYGKAIYAELEHHYIDKIVDAQLALKNAHKIGDVASIDQAAKQVADYQGELNKLTGKYQPPPSISPELDNLVNENHQRNAQQLLREQTSGVQIKPLLSDRHYLPHVITPEVRDAMSTKLKNEGKLPTKMSSKEFDDEVSNAIRREFVEINKKTVEGWAAAGVINKSEARTIGSKNVKDGLSKLDELLDNGKITEAQYTDAVHTLSIEEVNGLPKDVKMKIFGTDRDEIFHTDPIYHTTIRGIRGEVARTSAEFFSEMKARGLTLDDTNAPPNWVNVRQKELAGFKVSPEIARVLNKWDTFNTNPQELNKVLRVYDRFHSLSKIWTLAPFPAYHTLNAVGNFWNNFLAGVTNPDVYRQAAFVVGGKNVKFKDVFGQSWNTPKLIEKGKELGIIDRGQFGGDIERTLKQAMEGGKFLTLSSRNHLLRVGLRAGKMVENNARMAHFIDRLRKGDTAEQSALSVKKFLFDYGDLTDIEKKVMNRTFFFYSWTRNNIPLQLHSLVTTPGKFSIPFKAIHEVEKGLPPVDETYLPEWAKENMPMRIRFDSKTKRHEYFMLNKWLPASDLVKLVHLHEVAAQMIAPLPKEAIQQLWNYDFYFKKKIERFPGETVKFLGKDLPKRQVHAMKILRLLNEIDRLTKEDSDYLSKIVGISTGRNFMFDETQGMIANKSRVDDEISDLKSGLTRKGISEKEMNRIMSLIEEKVKEY